MAHPLFSPELRQMLHENDEDGIRAFCENLHPATIAETLAEDFSVDDAWRVLQHTKIRDQAAIFEYLPSATQVALVDGAGRPAMARLIEQMSHDDRVDLLHRLDPQVADGLLRLVDEADRRDIATLVNYPENTVGSLMTTDYAWLPANLTAAEAIDRLRVQAPDRETIYYVYVLEEPSRRLMGIISLRDLILAPRTAAVRELMEEEFVSLKANEDQEKAAEVLARFDLLAVPVIDDERRLVGIVTHDDMIDVVVQEATEDLQRQGAVGTITENYLEAGFVTVWRKRAFWLACLFGAELFTFTALSSFEDEIGKLVVLSLFIPLCLSTGGNSGSQAATLITRGLALGHFHIGEWLRVLRHELVMGIVLGLTLGVIAFVRGALTPEHTRGGDKEQDAPVTMRVPASTPLQSIGDGLFEMPKSATLEFESHAFQRVQLPSGEPLVQRSAGDHIEYRLPAGVKLQQIPVDRWKLAQVIALAVAAICLWGTLIGSMLPLVFKRIGADPALASSPFVATFVDVTGIVIYFSIAKIYLL